MRLAIASRNVALRSAQQNRRGAATPVVPKRFNSTNTEVIGRLEAIGAVIKAPSLTKPLIDKVRAAKAELPEDHFNSSALFTKQVISSLGETEASYKDLLTAINKEPVTKEVDFADLPLPEDLVDGGDLGPEATFVKQQAVDTLRSAAKRQSPFMCDLTEAVLPVIDKHWTLPNGNVKPSYYSWWNKVHNAMNVAEASKNTEPVRVAVTGAAGSIGYALVFRIASGQMFGPSTPVILHLLELPNAMKALKGVVMELEDCAFPLVKGIVPTDNINKGFEGVNWALLVGSKPRSKGMERGDLLMENAKIFQKQGKAIGAAADSDCNVVVVGNPANTNALIAQRNSGRDPKYFSALTRLDHNRGMGQLANKLGCQVTDLSRFCIWGNHSATQYPDISNVVVNQGGEKKLAREVINDQKWVESEFIPRVQKRGAEIIGARGASSAASAASAVVDHVHDWIHGTTDWTSVAIPSKGEYGVTEGIVYSYPVVCGPEGPNVVQDIPIDSFSQKRMEITEKELVGERDAVAKMLP